MRLRNHHLAAAASLAALAILAAACLQNPEANDLDSPWAAQACEASDPTERIGEAPAPMLWIGSEYGSKDFQFTVLRGWDGADGAGGERQALADLTFRILRGFHLPLEYRWDCPLDITMPVQTRKEGHISVSRAAMISAEVANVAVPAIVYSQPSWDKQGAIFCIDLQTMMNRLFRTKYPGYGAKVKRWLM